jgi:hypothetical protein
MQIEGKAGRTTVTSGATGVPIRTDDGAAMAVQLSGNYSEPAIRSRYYFAYCSAGAVTVPALITTGLAIYNPSTSGVNAVLGKWTLATITNAATTLGYVIAASAVTGVTLSAAATTTGCTNVTGSLVAGKVQAISSGTFAGAVPTTVALLCHNTAAIATTGADQMSGDLDGSVVVPPGYMAGIYAVGTTSGTTATCLAWEERPIAF